MSLPVLFKEESCLLIETVGKYWQRTDIVATALAAILAGLWLAKVGYSTNLNWVMVGFVSLPTLAKHRTLALVPALIIGVNIGLWRGAVVYSRLELYEQLQNKKITLLAKVDNDAAYSDRGQLEFQINSIVDSQSGRALPGTIRVRGFNAPSVRRGDIVSISGKLKDGFGSRQGFISYAQVEVVQRDGSLLETVRAKYFAGVFSALPEPQASLGLGFLVGTRTLLPDQLLLALTVTGLTHIVAVSGYNLTILVRLTRRLFAKRSVYLATVSSLGLIGAFVLITGLSPSIARATVVSTLALLAWYYGRQIRPILLILSAAAITAILNPLYLWFDLGWYLSFAAFAGILILAPLIVKRWFKTKPKLLGQIILETSCAQIMTLPIIAMSFSQVSVVSLLANVVVLPLIPLAMLLTFWAGLGGAIAPQLAGWLAWPANLLLTFMTDIIQLLARIPWALKPIDMSPTQLTVVYGAVLVVILGLSHRVRQRLNAVEVIE